MCICTVGYKDRKSQPWLWALGTEKIGLSSERNFEIGFSGNGQCPLIFTRWMPTEKSLLDVILKGIY